MKKYKDFERYAKIFEAVARGSTMTAVAKSNGISSGRVQQIIRDLQWTMLLPEIMGADTYKVPDVDTRDHVASVREHADFWLKKLEVLRAHVTKPPPQHLPGPWKLRRGGAYMYDFTIETADGAHVAAWCVPHIERKNTQARAKYIHAARLMTAAPELVKALRYIEGLALADEPRDLPTIARIAHEAIAKATGDKS